jgi:hypothetical protein
VLTAALALVALPGLGGSRSIDPIQPIPAGAIQQLTIHADDSRSTDSVGSLDDAHAAAGALSAGTAIVERGGTPDRARTILSQPPIGAASLRKPARYTLTGGATFYDNGTTAMRLPRGTIVVICGPGGCIERVVNDYGPQKPSRVVDLYRPDFFSICGCPSWAGTTTVTVYVY